MKKALFLLVCLLICALALCGCNGVIPNIGSQGDLEEVFEDLENLPEDPQEILEMLGDEVLVQDPVDSNATDTTMISVGNGAVVYQNISQYWGATEEHVCYSTVTMVTCLGSAKQTKGTTYQFRFVGANISIAIESEDAETVRQGLRDWAESLGLSEADAALMESLIAGEQIYADADSQLFELFSETPAKVTATYDEELGTFFEKKDYGYDEMYDSYSYELLGFNGETKQRVSYTLDGNGEKCIENSSEYFYLADGRTKYYNVSYTEGEDSRIVWLEDEYVYGETEEEWHFLWDRCYYTGSTTLENERFWNEDGYIEFLYYYGEGAVNHREISESYGGDALIDEYYWLLSDGTTALYSRLTVDGTICTWEMYYEDGKLDIWKVYDTSKLIGDEYLILEEKIGTVSGNVFEKKYDENNVPIEEYVYFDDGSWRYVTYEDGIEMGYIDYTAQGVPTFSEEYDKNGEITKQIDYHSNGSIWTVKEYQDGFEVYYAVYYENGNLEFTAEYQDGIICYSWYNEDGTLEDRIYE